MRSLRIEYLENRRVPAVLTVDSLADEPLNMEPDGVVTLREAIAAANANAPVGDAPAGSGVDTIFFSVDGTISVSEGEYEITEPLQIIGPGRDALALDGAKATRAFNITATEGDFVFQGLTLQNFITLDTHESAAEDEFSGGAIRSLSTGALVVDHTAFLDNATKGNWALGGAIYHKGSVVASYSEFDGNSTSRFAAKGGAVYASLSITTEASVFRNNSTAGHVSDGGALYTARGLTISKSEFVDNSTATTSADGGAAVGYLSISVGSSLFMRNVAGDDGGALYTYGSATLTDTSFVENRTIGENTFGGAVAASSSIFAHDSSFVRNSSIGYQVEDQFIGGGALASPGRDVIVSDSTFSGNSSGGPGGAIYSGRDLSLNYSTITDNHSDAEGGGVRAGGRYLRLSHSILAGNSSSLGVDDILRPQPSGILIRYSLIGDNFGSTLVESQTPDEEGSLIGSSFGEGAIDPLLAPLTVISSGAWFHLPLPGSPVIDAGKPDFSGFSLYDQRGEPFDRVVFGRIDMGAVEADEIGDFDRNGSVAGSDFLKMQRSLNVLPAEPGDAVPDANGDAVFDAEDLRIWEEQFATSSETMQSASVTAPIQAAPTTEPAPAEATLSEATLSEAGHVEAVDEAMHALAVEAVVRIDGGQLSRRPTDTAPRTASSSHTETRREDLVESQTLSRTRRRDAGRDRKAASALPTHARNLDSLRDLLSLEDASARTTRGPRTLRDSDNLTPNESDALPNA